jgi:hypothetical protein
VTRPPLGTLFGLAFHPTKNRMERALQRSGAKRFDLMSHWFYSMIGFGRAAQIQEGNENVV